MAIDSISRNTTSTTRQPVESRLTDGIKRAERQEANVQEIPKHKAEQPLQPVVNTQGQPTGTLINIIA